MRKCHNFKRFSNWGGTLASGGCAAVSESEELLESGKSHATRSPDPEAARCCPHAWHVRGVGASGVRAADTAVRACRCPDAVATSGMLVLHLNVRSRCYVSQRTHKVQIRQWVGAVRVCLPRERAGARLASGLELSYFPHAHRAAVISAQKVRAVANNNVVVVKKNLTARWSSAQCVHTAWSRSRCAAVCWSPASPAHKRSTTTRTSRSYFKTATEKSGLSSCLISHPRSSWSVSPREPLTSNSPLGEKARCVTPALCPWNSETSEPSGSEYRPTTYNRFRF